MSKFTLKVEEKVGETYYGNFQCKHHDNLCAIDMPTFNPKKSSKYIDMRSSFEDLVVTDLMVKTVFLSDFLFKR
jgi:hypothetical protein